jgi:hypothetical protein
MNDDRHALISPDAGFRRLARLFDTYTARRDWYDLALRRQDEYDTQDFARFARELDEARAELADFVVRVADALRAEGRA